MPNRPVNKADFTSLILAKLRQPDLPNSAWVSLAFLLADVNQLTQRFSHHSRHDHTRVKPRGTPELERLAGARSARKMSQGLDALVRRLEEEQVLIEAEEELEDSEVEDDESEDEEEES